MKRAVLFLLLIVLLSVPTRAVANQPDELPLTTADVAFQSQENIDTKELSRSDQWVNRNITSINTFGTVGMYAGTALVAVGTAVHIYNELTPKPTTDVMPPRYAIPGMTWIVGGAIVALALPIHLWGVHLVNQNDASTFIPRSERLGWQGIVDVGGGLNKVASIGATYGYNVNHNLFVGLGMGISQRFCIPAEEMYADQYTTPVYLNFRMQFSSSLYSPFVGIKFGADLDPVVPLPYGSIDWGMRVRCKESANAWWYSLNLSTHDGRDYLGFRVARTF